MPYLAIFETLSPTKVETPQDVKNLISIFTTLEEEEEEEEKIKYSCMLSLREPTKTIR